MSKEVPEPWAAAMEAAKLVDPRNGRPSMRALALEAGTGISTISAMVHGTRDTTGDVLRKVIAALHMEDRGDEVAQWVGLARSQPRQFVAHQDADLLTSEEQEAVNELIRLLALPKKAGGEAGAGSTPAIKAPDSGPGLYLAADAARKTRKGTARQRREADDAT